MSFMGPTDLWTHLSFTFRILRLSGHMLYPFIFLDFNQLEQFKGDSGSNNFYCDCLEVRCCSF